MEGLNLEKHFSLTSCDLIQQICDPVLKIAQTKLSYFRSFLGNNFFVNAP